MSEANEISKAEIDRVENMTSLLASSDIELLHLISSESKTKFEAQVGLMLAADQRALAIAGLGAGLSAVGLGVVFAAGADKSWTSFETAALITAAVSFVGAIICFYACAPRDIYLPGWRAEDFKSELEAKADTASTLASMIAWVDYRIIDNDVTLNKNHQIFTRGAIGVFGAPIAGAVAGVIHILLSV